VPDPRDDPIKPARVIGQSRKFLKPSAAGMFSSRWTGRMPWIGAASVRIISAHCQAWWIMGGNLAMYRRIFRLRSVAAANGEKVFCPQTSEAVMYDLCHRNTRLARSATLISMEKGMPLSNRLHSELRIPISIADESSDGFITDRQTLQKYLVIFEFER